jgi:hypothetical protein
MQWNSKLSKNSPFLALALKSGLAEAMCRSVKPKSINSGMLIYLNDLWLVTSRYTQLCYWFIVVGLAIYVDADMFTAVIS